MRSIFKRSDSTKELIKKVLLEEFDSELRAHLLNTASIAAEHAHKFGISSETAWLAGVVHDYAKKYDISTQIRIALECGYSGDDFCIRNPSILHSFIGPHVVSQELGIEDEEVLSAVRKHCVAAPEMSNLDKLIYVCDKAEPSRPFGEAGLIRQKLTVGLDKAFIEALRVSIKYVLEKGKPLYPGTVEAWNVHVIALNGARV